MLTLDQAQEEYGLTRPTLYRWARRGELRIYRRAGDRKSYVRRDEVERLRGFRPKELGAQT